MGEHHSRPITYCLESYESPFAEFTCIVLSNSGGLTKEIGLEGVPLKQRKYGKHWCLTKTDHRRNLSQLDWSLLVRKAEKTSVK